VTTSTNTTTQSVLHVLADYDLHHSGIPANPSEPAPPNERRDSDTRTSNPPGWDEGHNRVPPYRPINRNLDMELRPGGANVPEAIFIATLLNGVNLNANINRLWRATGGRLNDKLFRYEIGGEW